MKILITAALLVASLFGAPVVSQAPEAKFVVHIVNHSKDALGTSFYKALEAQIKSDMREDGQIVEQDSDKDDQNAPVISVLAIQCDDTDAKVAIVVEVSYHVKGEIYDRYIGSMAGPLAKGEEKDAAGEIAPAVEGAIGQFESDNAPSNSNPKS